MAGIDYRNRYKDYSIFLLSVSEMYSRLHCNPNPKREFPKLVPQDDLNFLKPDCNLWHIPYALYSAGQAAKSDTAAKKTDCMFTSRDRTTSTIVGDSGGYQIQTTAIKWEGNKTRARMLDWLERNCDWSMILDFPTGGINIGNLDPHIQRLIEEGVDLRAYCESLGFNPNDHQKLAYSACLYQTLQNNDYFVKHRRPGMTNFLNVIQGRNLEESNIWYSKVKHYPFEAWALAGPHKENFEMTMRRLIMMRDDGLLEKKDWIHILGVGKLMSGAIFTTMQRSLRETVNPRLTISYDVSSPFTLAAYGKCFFGYTLDKDAWSLSGDKIDGREFLPGGTRAKVPFLTILKEEWDKKGLKTEEQGGNGVLVQTEVGKKLTMDDICVNDDPKFTSTWDVVSYGLMMNHNAQLHLEAVFNSQDMYDKEDKNHVPQGMLVLKSLIPEIFKSENPLSMIEKHRKELNYLAGDAAERGVQELGEFNMTSISNHLKSLSRLEEATKIRNKKLEAVMELFGGSHLNV